MKNFPAPSKRSSTHYVYLISDRRGRTKVGHARNPFLRLSQLQVSCPDKLTVEHVWPVPKAECAALERDLHKLLEWCCIRGGWHNLPPEDIRKLGDAMVAGHLDKAAWAADLMRRAEADEPHLRGELYLAGMSGNPWDVVFTDASSPSIQENG